MDTFGAVIYVERKSQGCCTWPDQLQDAQLRGKTEHLASDSFRPLNEAMMSATSQAQIESSGSDEIHLRKFAYLQAHNEK